MQSKIFLLTGISLLLMAVLAGIGFGYAFQSIHLPNDPTGTLAAFTQNQGLLMLTILSFSFILLLDVLVAYGLYAWLKHVHSTAATITSALRIAYCIMLGIALMPLLSLWNTPAGELTAETTFHQMEQFLSIWSGGLFVFGFHLLAMAWTLSPSTQFPSWMRYLLGFAGVGYMLIHGLNLCWPGFATLKPTADAVMAAPLALSELALAFWLIVKNKKMQRGLNK